MVEDEDSIKQAILMLLATSKGERLMRPEYGCELYKLVFSPNDETTAGLAIHYVRQAVTRFEPRIRITRLDAGKRISGQASDGAAGDLENNRLYIELEYQIRATSQVDRVELSLSLTGGDD
jgi:phage baseplate assembly protein W